MKKKQVEMPKLKNSKFSAKESDIFRTKIGYYTVGIVLLVVVAFFSVTYFWSKNHKKEATEYISKGVVTNYVCKIVGADPETEMVAVQCLTK